MFTRKNVPNDKVLGRNPAVLLLLFLNAGVIFSCSVPQMPTSGSADAQKAGNQHSSWNRAFSLLASKSDDTTQASFSKTGQGCCCWLSHPNL